MSVELFLDSMAAWGFATASGALRFSFDGVHLRHPEGCSREAAQCQHVLSGLQECFTSKRLRDDGRWLRALGSRKYFPVCARAPPPGRQAPFRSPVVDVRSKRRRQSVHGQRQLCGLTSRTPWISAAMQPLQLEKAISAQGHLKPSASGGS